MPPRRPPRAQTPPPANPENMMDLMRQFIQAVGQQQTAPQAPQAPPAQACHEERTLEKFLRFNPPRFHGEPDDIKAGEWVADIEQIFRVVQCGDPERVEYAVFLMKGQARDWWKLVEQKWVSTGIEYTWEQFLIEFREKYIPEVLRDRRE